MTQHTPGPWHTNGREIYTTNRHGCVQDNIAEMWRVSIGKGLPEKEIAANAAAMAAAPEMLAALQELCADKYLADPINADRMAKARAAVAKATQL